MQILDTLIIDYHKPGLICKYVFVYNKVIENIKGCGGAWLLLQWQKNLQNSKVILAYTVSIHKAESHETLSQPCRLLQKDR